MEMVAPGLIGLWIDRQVGTEAAFAVGGFVLGMVLGVYKLVAFAKEQSQKNLQNKIKKDVADDSGDVQNG